MCYVSKSIYPSIHPSIHLSFNPITINILKSQLKPNPIAFHLRIYLFLSSLSLSLSRLYHLRCICTYMNIYIYTHTCYIFTHIIYILISYYIILLYIIIYIYLCINKYPLYISPTSYAFPRARPRCVGFTPWPPGSTPWCRCFSSWVTRPKRCR